MGYDLSAINYTDEFDRDFVALCNFMRCINLILPRLVFPFHVSLGCCFLMQLCQIDKHIFAEGVEFDGVSVVRAHALATRVQLCAFAQFRYAVLDSTVQSRLSKLIGQN